MTGRVTNVTYVTRIAGRIHSMKIDNSSIEMVE